MDFQARVGIDKLEENGEDITVLIETTLKQVNSRRRNRDQVLLRVCKRNAMKILADDLREWITQEAKDILIVIEILKATKNPAVLAEINPHEVKVKEIQNNFVRRVITPMRKFAKGSSGAKNEEEHCRQFRIALDNVFGMILELQKIREQTDIHATVFSGQPQSTDAQSYVR